MIRLRRNSETWAIAIWVLLLLPMVSFFWMLVANSHNVPEMDDYDALLGFMNHFVAAQGAAQKLLYFVTAQHMQYRLWFEHAVVLGEYAFTGKVNFVFLQQLGNSFVALIAVVLWLMFRPGRSTLRRRALLFCPVVFLLCAPRYGGTLDWAMGGLQNLTVIFFSVLCIYLSGKSSRIGFAGACAAEVLAIASSLNGFVGAFAGFLFLLQQGQRRRAAYSALLALGALALYADQYQRVTMPVTGHHSVWLAVPMVLGFLGSALGKSVAVAFGAVLLGSMVFLTGRRWYGTDPATMYAAYFVMLTAVGLSLSRHDQGLGAAYASRYTIYSQLLILLLYMAAVRMEGDRLQQKRWGRAALAGFFAVTSIFCAASQYAGFRTLHVRTEAVRTHYLGWLNHPEAVSLLPKESEAMQAPEMRGFQEHAAKTLEESRSRHLYGAAH